MTVRELRSLLDPADDSLEVNVRAMIPGDGPEPWIFEIEGLTKTLERDTAETVIVIECGADR